MISMVVGAYSFLDVGGGVDLQELVDLWRQSSVGAPRRRTDVAIF